MVIERIDWRLRRRQHLDVESLEQGPGSERLCAQSRANGIEVMIGRLLIEYDVESEDHTEDMTQP